MAVLVGVLVAALALTSCSANTAASESPAQAFSPAATAPSDITPGDGSYIASSQSDVAFVRWTDHDGTLAGTFSYVKANLQSSTGTEATQTSFTGVRHDDNVSLTLSQGLGSYTSLTGTVSGSGQGSTLDLAIPQADGQLATVAFHYATIADYNSAVTDLGVNAQLQSQAEASAAAASKAAQQQQADQQALTGAIRVLEGASLTSHIKALQAVRTQTARHLATLKEHAAIGVGIDCENVSITLYDDASNTLYDDQEDALYSEIQSLKDDIAAIEGARRALLNVEATVSGTDRLSIPDAADRALEGADDAVAAAIASANKTIKAVAADVAAGYAIVNEMASGDCASEGPGSPPKPLPMLPDEPNYKTDSQE